MDGRRQAILEFPGAPPFKRAAATDSPRLGRLLNKRRDAERARGLPAAVVEGRRAAEAARRRGAGRAVRRVALGRVENGALRARGGSGARRYFFILFAAGPACVGALGAALGALRE